MTDEGFGIGLCTSLEIDNIASKLPQTLEQQIDNIASKLPQTLEQHIQAKIQGGKNRHSPTTKLN